MERSKEILTDHSLVAVTCHLEQVGRLHFQEIKAVSALILQNLVQRRYLVGNRRDSLSRQRGKRRSIKWPISLGLVRVMNIVILHSIMTLLVVVKDVIILQLKFCLGIRPLEDMLFLIKPNLSWITMFQMRSQSD